MGYEVSLNKAWGAIKNQDKKLKVKFINDEYDIDLVERAVLSRSCNVEAKDYYKILILHYVANSDNIEDISKDKWISFKELEGGKEYFPAFRKRAVEPILRKYGDDPRAIFERIGYLNAEKLDMGSAAISINVFPKIKVGLVLWEKDDEFAADCNIVFNSGIKYILPTEDAAVLGGIVASVL